MEDKIYPLQKSQDKDLKKKFDNLHVFSANVFPFRDLTKLLISVRKTIYRLMSSTYMPMALEIVFLSVNGLLLLTVVLEWMNH